MRIPPPIVQPQNLFQSGGLRPDSNPANSAGVQGSAALARAGALDAATARSGLTTAPSNFDSEAPAKTILEMVGAQLAEAVARGASPQELGNLLQQAREGAQNGFDAAIAQLQELGELDDSLSSGISAALQKVDKGFEALANQFGLNSAAPPSTAAPAPSLGELAGGYGERFANGQSADLTIKTADGDTVKLRINANSSADGSRSSSGISMEVEGNLDADEQKALGELVDRVGKLADSFFGGDMESALQQADSFQFDNPELSSMSLTLRRSVTAYQDVQSLGSDALADYAAVGNGATPSAPAASTASGVKARLAEQLTTLLPEASFSENPAGTLKELLAAQVAAKGQEESPMLDFANRLLDAMGASATAAAQQQQRLA